MKQKPLRVGFDFDGVIAYNPLRIFRAPITLTKRHLLGMKETKFSYPNSALEKKIWALLHEFSFFPGVGFSDLKTALTDKTIEGYLITGRFGYLEPSLMKWLKKHGIHDLFTDIVVNRRDEQPHLYKARAITSLGLDAFVEDNWDIVEHLQTAVPKTHVYWIYNIFDRGIAYAHKHPHLRSALSYLTASYSSVPEEISRRKSG